jgi:hypothetical protein
MDWRSYRASKGYKRGIKDGTHLVSVYLKGKLVSVDTDLVPADLVAVLMGVTESASGCTVRLRVPKPAGFWAGLVWKMRTLRGALR